jgi:hypothetical protein
MRAIAASDAPAAESGWACFARRRYARAISSRDALRGTPRTTYGSNSVTTAAVYADPSAILSAVVTKRTRKAPARAKPAAGDPSSTIEPSADAAAALATVPSAGEAPIDGAQLDAAILRFLRRYPNQTVDLGPLARELQVDPYRIQLAVESLAQRRMVVAPFIEPGTAGGATLTQIGLRWLLDREGGTPADVPIALQLAKDHVRASDEAARLPRAQVYGLNRGSDR